jgi:hypothetical protein
MVLSILASGCCCIDLCCASDSLCEGSLRWHLLHDLVMVPNVGFNTFNVCQFGVILISAKGGSCDVECGWKPGVSNRFRGMDWELALFWRMYHGAGVCCREWFYVLWMWENEWATLTISCWCRALGSAP